ncbi:MAG TPA: hypothetical protein VJT13_27755 [Xanthobacteraceae bacterium]|nr:hypothetical protein [Xanthobacteraceae bacterium]
MRIRHVMVGLVGALALGTAVPASAGPLPIGNSALTTAAAPATTEIRWRRGPGPGIAFGLAAGALVGAAVAARPYGYYGYDYGPGYVYDAPVYGAPYAYEPVYPGYGYYGGYGYGYGQCYTNDGYGRRRPCSGQ